MKARLGLTVPTIPMAPPIAVSCLELAQDLAERGYQEAWLAELNAAESYALAGALSQRAPTLRIGTAVVPAQTRTPMVHAMGALTLSELTGGRFALGLGISSENIVRDWGGQPFDKPLTRMREHVDVIRAALAGEKVNHTGATLQVKNFRLGGTPPSAVPILLGALNRKMLELAGERADGVLLNMVPEGKVGQLLGHVRGGCEAAGRDTRQQEVVARLHVHVVDKLAEGRDAIRAMFAPYVATAGYNRFFCSIGFEQQAKAVAEAFARRDRAGCAAAMSDELCDAIGVVGDMQRVRSRIQAYVQAGVDVIVINPIAPDAGEQRRVFEALADVLESCGDLSPALERSREA